MKKFMYLSLVIMLLLACSKSETEAINDIENSIVGTWQLVEINEESNSGWQSVENGGTVEYKSNGVVISSPENSGESCASRTYQISIIPNSDDELTYFCNGEFSSTITFEITEENQLILKSIWALGKFDRRTNQN